MLSQTVTKCSLPCWTTADKTYSVDTSAKKVTKISRETECSEFDHTKVLRRRDYRWAILKTSTLHEVQNSWRNYTRTCSTTKRHQQKACRAKPRQHFHAMRWDWVTDLCLQIWKHMGRKLLKTVQTITNFRNPLADPVGTRRGPPLVRGPQFENRCPMPFTKSGQRHN